MPAAKAATLESPRPADEVFAALQVVAQDGSYEIAGLSHEQHELLFRSGKTALSWGHLYVASVVPSGSGAVLQLTTVGVPGAPKSLMDGRKNLKAGQKVVAAVEEVLTLPGPPAPTSTASFATLADGSTVPWTSGAYPGA